MVLKKSPKRWQTIWFTEAEELRLKSFVSQDVKSEIALNSTCTEAVNMVLEDDILRKRLQERIDKNIQKSHVSWKSLVCAWCGWESRNTKGAEAHVNICQKRPLEVVVN